MRVFTVLVIAGIASASQYRPQGKANGIYRFRSASEPSCDALQKFVRHAMGWACSHPERESLPDQLDGFTELEKAYLGEWAHASDFEFMRQQSSEETYSELFGSMPYYDEFMRRFDIRFMSFRDHLQKIFDVYPTYLRIGDLRSILPVEVRTPFVEFVTNYFQGKLLDPSANYEFPVDTHYSLIDALERVTVLDNYRVYEDIFPLICETHAQIKATVTPAQYRNSYIGEMERDESLTPITQLYKLSTIYLLSIERALKESAAYLRSVRERAIEMLMIRRTHILFHHADLGKYRFPREMPFESCTSLRFGYAYDRALIWLDMQYSTKQQFKNWAREYYFKALDKVGSYSEEDRDFANWLKTEDSYIGNYLKYYEYFQECIECLRTRI